MYNKIVNKTIKYLILSILFISIFIISLFVFPPIYATDDFSNYIAPVGDTPTDTYGVNLVYTYSGITYSRHITSSIDNTYYFIVANGNNSTLYFVNTNSFTIYSKSVGGTSIYPTNSNFNGTYNLYVVPYSSSFPISNYECDALVFNSFDDGMSSVKDFIDNPPPSEPSLYEGLNIPAGYIARILVKNGTQFTLNTTMGTDNIAYQDKWVYTSQWYKFNDTASPEIAMATDGITIPWVRSGNTNILGQTNKAKYTINSSIGTYVWVLNPAYMVGQNADLYDTKLNSAIQLTDVVDVLQVRIFALKSTYTWGGIVSSTSTGSGIEYDPSTGNWLDDNDNPIDPVDYGDTNVPTTGTTLIQQFESLLSNLINRIERLLVAPVDYINQLIASANQFFLWLRGLWSWLPAPVIESITAVLIVMCTVGALKLLWR